MKQYHTLLEDVMTNGKDRGDRTGTGTRSVFGRQVRFDLSQGFPLLTTKKMFVGGTVAELLWFLSGSTNTQDLPKSVRHWWTPWQKADGSLGPIYGEQYRYARWWFLTEVKTFEPYVPEPKEGLVYGVGDLGEFKRKPHHGVEPEEAMLKEVWRNMLRRCYDPTCRSYAAYGAVGVHVAPEWLNFGKFFEDAKTLIGYTLKKHFPKDYSIDKDILHASNRYSKETCCWASHDEQGFNVSNQRAFTAVSPEGENILFPSIGEAKRLFGLNLSAVHRCLNGKLHTHHGWSEFKYTSEEPGKVQRFRQLDQLKLLIANIKEYPESRRHVVNLWATPAMEHAQLPCCHGSVIQFYVCDGQLSCQVYQRSADIFLGVPVNIASYALLTHIIAAECGLEVGDLSYTFGDLHLYHNHFEQAEELLSRVPRDLPKLVFQPKPIDKYAVSDFTLAGYDPHPAIKAEVAV
jgi:thymidylate synthase